MVARPAGCADSFGCQELAKAGSQRQAALGERWVGAALCGYYTAVANEQAWGIPNLFVCDGSVMPTQGSANPALTIMTLASRLGQLLAAKRVAATAGRATTTKVTDQHEGALGC